VLLRGGYDGAVNLARAASLVAPTTNGKVLRSFAARRGVRARFQAWAALNRDRSRPLLWMHAPSVGEGLQAREVVNRVRERRPEVQIVYTFYSPSAEQFARDIAADYRDYLPFDTMGDARATITAIAPTAFVYSKLDLWPNFTRVASLRGIRLGMISATVSPGSKRRGFMARRLLREAYSRLDAVGAISDDDAARILELGARPEVVFVTGDKGFFEQRDPANGLAISLRDECAKIARPIQLFYVVFYLAVFGLVGGCLAYLYRTRGAIGTSEAPPAVEANPGEPPGAPVDGLR